MAELASWRRLAHKPDVIAAAAAEWRAASQAGTPSAFYFPDEMPVKEWLSRSIDLKFEVDVDAVLAKVSAASSVASTLDTTWTTCSLRELRGTTGGPLSMATWTKAMAEFIGHLTAAVAGGLAEREPELDVEELEQSLLDLVDKALSQPWPTVASTGSPASSSSTPLSSSREPAAEGSESGELTAAVGKLRLKEEETPMAFRLTDEMSAREWLTSLVCDVLGVQPDAAMLAKLQSQNVAFSQSNGWLRKLPRGKGQGLVQICGELWDLFVSHEINPSGEEASLELQIRQAMKESDVEELKQALIERLESPLHTLEHARSLVTGTQSAPFVLPDEMLLKEWLAPVVCSALGVADTDLASVQEAIETSGEWLPKGPMPLRLFQNTAYLRNLRRTEGLAEVSELLYNLCDEFIEVTPMGHTLQHTLERALIKHLDAKREAGAPTAADVVDAAVAGEVAEVAAVADAAEAAETEEAAMEGYMDQVFSQNVQQLLQMGFSEDLAEAAMELAGDDVGQAMELCLDADFQEEIAKRSASAAPRRRRAATAAPAATAPPPDRIRLTPAEAVGLEVLGVEVSWLERYADVQRGVQATLQAKFKQASKERKDSNAALKVAQQEARTEREGRRSDRTAEELQRGEMVQVDKLRHEREVKAAVEREGKALRAKLEREAKTRLGYLLTYYLLATSTYSFAYYLLATTTYSHTCLLLTRLEASEKMVATLSAEKKAKEASSDAERRDAKEARKAVAESQREVGSLRQEAVKVRLAALHPPCPLRPLHPLHLAPCNRTP